MFSARPAAAIKKQPGSYDCQYNTIQPAQSLGTPEHQQNNYKNTDDNYAVTVSWAHFSNL